MGYTVGPSLLATQFVLTYLRICSINTHAYVCKYVSTYICMYIRQYLYYTLTISISEIALIYLIYWNGLASVDKFMRIVDGNEQLFYVTKADLREYRKLDSRSISINHNL